MDSMKNLKKKPKIVKFTATRLGFWCQGGALLIILSLRSHSLNPIFSTTKHAKKFSFCEIYVPKV